MKKRFLLVVLLILSLTGFTQAETLVVNAGDGNLNEVIGADTLADGTQAHDMYQLVTLDMTYKFTAPITPKGDITIVGVLDPTTLRPPCIQPAVLPDASIPDIMLSMTVNGSQAMLENLYLLALATNNTANGAGTAIMVTANEVDITVENCVFDGWLGFGIGYNGNWCDFFINGCDFRNFVHPNQHYVGEVIRNTWPNEAYTDTLIMTNNTMFCVNGYAAAPVTKFYETYFEFVGNKVLWTFKNPMFIFNVTNAKINNNDFYGTYVGGVDTNENPWWDNLWEPDTTYGVIALQPLSEANAKLFLPGDSLNPDILALAEAARTVEVKDNICFWPEAVTDFWDSWNATEANTVITPDFISERTQAMFADDATWPNLVDSDNSILDPGYMATLDNDVLNGTIGNDIGILSYFEQIRSGTALTDVWGYGITQVSGETDWVPEWPLPEASVLPTTVREEGTARPDQFALANAYPNPFNPSTTIEYMLNTDGITSLSVYNVLGRNIMTLVDREYQNAGLYKRSVSMTGFTSGMYFVVLEHAGDRAIQKIMLLK